MANNINVGDYVEISYGAAGGLFLIVDLQSREQPITYANTEIVLRSEPFNETGAELRLVYDPINNWYRIKGARYPYEIKFIGKKLPKMAERYQQQLPILYGNEELLGQKPDIYSRATNFTMQPTTPLNPFESNVNALNPVYPPKPILSKSPKPLGITRQSVQFSLPNEAKVPQLPTKQLLQPTKQLLQPTKQLLPPTKQLLPPPLSSMTKSPPQSLTRQFNLPPPAPEWGAPPPMAKSPAPSLTRQLSPPRSRLMPINAPPMAMPPYNPSTSTIPPAMMTQSNVYPTASASRVYPSATIAPAARVYPVSNLTSRVNKIAPLTSTFRINPVNTISPVPRMPVPGESDMFNLTNSSGSNVTESTVTDSRSSNASLGSLNSSGSGSFSNNNYLTGSKENLANYL